MATLPIEVVTSKPLNELDIHDLCKELELDINLFGTTITLPVNFTLSVSTPVIPNPGDIAGKLLAQANAALAPFTPIFDFVDLLLILKEVLDAVKTLQPPKIAVKIGKFVAKLDKLKKLIPQLSIPTSIRDIINVLILFLLGLRNDILAILEAQTKIDLAGQRATALGIPDLTASLECAQFNLDFQLDLVRNNAAPLNRLITTINLFCSIAQLPEIPPLLLDATAGAGELLAPIDSMIEVLTNLRAKIPV